MSAVQAKLEALFARVRALPEPLQEAAVDALSEIADQPYQLSDDELAVLRPAFERARRGEFVPESEADDLLDKPWRSTSG
jgi:hypothetical protein